LKPQCDRKLREWGGRAEEGTKAPAWFGNVCWKERRQEKAEKNNEQTKSKQGFFNSSTYAHAKSGKTSIGGLVSKEKEGQNESSGKD